MRRRTFIKLLGGAASGFAASAALRPRAAMAQTSRRPLVACLIAASRGGNERVFAGFLQGMRELGYVEGQSWSLESRYAEGDQARAPLLAEELVRLKPDVIVSGSMAGVIALKKLTDTIPIVSP